MWVVEFTDSLIPGRHAVYSEFATKEDALVDMVERKFMWPECQWRVIDPDGNVVS